MSETLEFKTVEDAVRYLAARGWQASTKSLYRHIKSGWISEKPWTSDHLDAYAAAHLRPVSTGASAPIADRPAKGHAAELLEERKKKLRIERELKELELEKEHGKLMLVEDHIAKSCRELMVVRDAVFNWILENAADLIAGCKGNLEYQYDIVSIYRRGFAKYWSRLDFDQEVQIPDVEEFKREPILQ